jgi:hypothetical protein
MVRQPLPGPEKKTKNYCPIVPARATYKVPGHAGQELIANSSMIEQGFLE